LIATSPEAAISSVCPSGGALATAPAAIIAAAPARFSIKTGWPSAALIGSPSSRATMSTPPPAA
jgi:hypothetical protein